MSSSTNTGRPTQRRGLGRGLGSLIPTAPAGAPAPADPTPGDGVAAAGPGAGARRRWRRVRAGGAAGGARGRARSRWPAPTSPSSRSRRSRPTARQPRQVFDEEAMAELVHSIREVGLLQPVVVRRTGDEAYELVMGERRWRAAQEAGLETIPAIVRETDDDDMLRDALLENLHRSQLNPLEEAAAYAAAARGLRLHPRRARHADRPLAARRSATRCGCCRLSPAVQRRVAAGVLSAGHARALLARRGRRPPGPARPARRRRGHQRPRAGGDRRGRRPREAAAPRPARRKPDRPRPRRARRPALGPARDPGQGRPGQAARARSPSSSPRWTTSSGSST